MSVCIVYVGLYMSPVRADNTYSVAITIQGLPPNLATDVYIDAAFNGTLNGGATANYSLSIMNNPHAIVVDSYVVGNVNGTRYYANDTTWGVSGPASHVFTYAAQYLLSIQTAYGSANGAGWYNSGAVAHATLTSGEEPEGQGTRNIFTSWGGDATGTQLASNEMVMSAPKLAIANWKTQFFLTVESDPPNITNLTGSGWYDEGTQANFSAPVIVPATSDTRLKLSHWGGEYSGVQPNGVTTMNRPKTVKADYLPQYLLTIVYEPTNIISYFNDTHAGWYDTNSSVQLGPAPPIINVSAEERLQFSGWTAGGSEYKDPSYIVAMDNPRNVTLVYDRQYYVDVQSTYGTASGSGWYDPGATATIVAPTSSGTWPISYTLSGWTVNPPTGTLTRNGDSWSLNVDGPYVVQAQWSMDYFPVVLLFGGSAAITAVGVGMALAYRRGIFSRDQRPLRPQKIGRTSDAAGTTTVCSNCGNSVATGISFCEKCGSSIGPISSRSLDDRVYDYIVKHEGVISLSKASADLGISIERLKEITERLKMQGRLA
jgi:hypothetical protein